jgi:hypothetical protein
MIISHHRQFVFVHIHKTAGESITASLLPVLTPEDLVLVGRQSATVNDVTVTKHSPARDVRDMLQTDTWDRYFTFAFVRHPIERTLSLYRYMSERSRPPNITVAQRLGLRPTPAYRDRSDWPGVRAYRETHSISEFIRHPLLDDTKSMKPQCASLCDEKGNLLVDYVGRFERLNHDFAFVEQRLGFPPLPLKRTNGSRQRRSDDYELSLEDRAYLTTRFEEDFRRFGYDP